MASPVSITHRACPQPEQRAVHRTRIEQRRDLGGLRRGEGRLLVGLVEGQSAALTLSSAAPLRLLAPRPRGASVWVLAGHYGGGLVAGDEIAIEVEVEAGASALLSTQAEGKVYRSRGAESRTGLQARVGEGATLALLPDPMSCFAGSRLTQVQRLELAAGASLLFLDGLVPGRAARGERWAFESYSSRLEVAREGRLVLADAVRLVDGEGPKVAARMGELELMATVVLLGPRVARAALAILADVEGSPAEPGAEVLVAASPVEDGLHARIAARRLEAGLTRVRTLLSFVSEILAEDPFTRRP